MNRFDHDKEYAKANGAHYNRCAPRVRQGQTRADKGGYRPTFMRAAHDAPKPAMVAR